MIFADLIQTTKQSDFINAMTETEPSLKPSPLINLNIYSNQIAPLRENEYIIIYQELTSWNTPKPRRAFRKANEPVMVASSYYCLKKLNLQLQIHFVTLKVYLVLDFLFENSE